MYQHKLLTLTILAVFLSISCATSSEAEDVELSPKPSISADEALTKAEQLYQGREDLEKVREAIKTLEQARDMDSRDYKVEWNYARYSYFLGSRKTIDDAEAEKTLKKGLSAAKIAKRVEPDKPDGHFWYAAVLGEQAKRNPLTKGITSVGEIRKTLNKVIEIEPSYQGASAYDALGQLEMGTRNLGGSAEKAVEYYKKGLELEKENAYLYFHSGEAYVALKQKDKAKEMLDKVLNLKPNPDFLPEYKEAEADAKKLLKEKF